LGRQLGGKEVWVEFQSTFWGPEKNVQEVITWFVFKMI